MGERTENVVEQDLGEVLALLASVVHGRRQADASESYTARLLQGSPDKLLSKLVEESCEVVMAAKDNDHDHLRYEMADVLYHLLVICERWGVSLEELGGELAARRR